MRSLLVIAAVVAGLPASSQDFQWKGTIAPGRAIEIKGVHGHITAELPILAESFSTKVPGEITAVSDLVREDHRQLQGWGDGNFAWHEEVTPGPGNIPGDVTCL